MGKTIAQLAIMKWIEAYIGISNLEIKFVEPYEAYVTDCNGDSITVKYDSDAKEVFAF